MSICNFDLGGNITEKCRRDILWKNRLKHMASNRNGQIPNQNKIK